MEVLHACITRPTMSTMLLSLLLYLLECSHTIRFIGSSCLQGIDYVNSYLLKESIINTLDKALVDPFFFFDFAAAGTLGAKAFLLVA